MIRQVCWAHLGTRIDLAVPSWPPGAGTGETRPISSGLWAAGEGEDVTGVVRAPAGGDGGGCGGQGR